MRNSVFLGKKKFISKDLSFKNIYYHAHLLVHTYIYMTMCSICNIYDIESRMLACDLACIIFRGHSHENDNLNFICYLTDIFTRCMFFTSKTAFDKHDTRQMFALRDPLLLLL